MAGSEANQCARFPTDKHGPELLGRRPEEAFEKSARRDRNKQRKCTIAGVKLVHVHPGYDRQERNRPANPPYQRRRACLMLSFAERKTRA